MATGKLENETLQDILQSISFHRKEVLVGAGVGLDTSQIDFGEKICVLSTDPITGAKENIGSLAVDISVNDTSTSGAENIGVLLTILAPEGTTPQDIREIMADASKRAEELEIEIVGGHTEITDAVNRFVLSSTSIGILDKKDQIPADKIKEGDSVYVSKYIGIEGTAILAHDKEKELQKIMTQEELDYAKSLLKWISVQDDAKYAKNKDLSYMHDVTEGGLLGAVYEAHQGIKKGIEINCESVPVLEVTHKICDYFNIKPFRLISSGSMLIISSDENLEKKFEGSNIKLTKIGLVKGEDPILITNGESERILPPYADELYKVI